MNSYIRTWFMCYFVIFICPTDLVKAVKCEVHTTNTHMGILYPEMYEMVNGAIQKSRTFTISREPLLFLYIFVSGPEIEENSSKPVWTYGHKFYRFDFISLFLGFRWHELENRKKRKNSQQFEWIVIEPLIAFNVSQA